MENRELVTCLNKIDITRIKTGDTEVVNEICKSLGKLYEFQRNIIEKDLKSTIICGLRIIIINNFDDYYKNEFEKSNTAMMHHRIFIINNNISKDVEQVNMEIDLTKPKRKMTEKDRKIVEIYGKDSEKIMNDSKRIMNKAIKGMEGERISILVKHMLMKINEISFEQDGDQIMGKLNFDKTPMKISKRKSSEGNMGEKE